MSEESSTELICYLHPGWEPLIRPAPTKREWMSNTQDSFAYRCLPLDIANAHGWEVLTPNAFEARWSGGTSTDAIEIRYLGETSPHTAPCSLFGHGILTFHIPGLFRTPQGWNMWIGGTPNSPKDGIYPLTGIVETDWAPFTFTMNWKFTRPDHWVRFEAEEPICFFYPVPRGYLEGFLPRMAPMEEDPELFENFKLWSSSRKEFHEKMAEGETRRSADAWQKHYFKGIGFGSSQGVEDHQVKLTLNDFTLG